MQRLKITNLITSLAVAVASVAFATAPFDAEAKRLGGGRASGMQRQMPAKQADTSPPASPNNAATNGATSNAAARPNQAAPANAAQAAAQPAKRSWMGPIAGLAAGLGLAALASHLGFGEELANFMMMALLAVVALVAITWVVRRMRGGAAASAGGPQLAGAGAPFPSSAQPSSAQPFANPAQAPMARDSFAAGGLGASVAPSGASAAGAAPAGFDAEGFTRIAKMIFIRLQAANDAGNVDDLRKFTTPELFASLRLDLQERGAASQQTDVMQLDAELVDTTQENGQWIASVRFHGLIREEAAQGAQPFDELWHLVKPLDDGREWAIAGITPLQG
ncbi:MAG: Tim44 domain-containing protein [Burkholderiales bacterium]|nr:Tim44 domain-containing protein [Burkholderiales bacterium]MBH2017853.1 Tim44 domain-containing protein [Burkholderiales bacterium]